MPFKLGDKVMVTNLKKGGAIVEVLKEGEYRVAVGSFALLCKEKDLKELPASNWKQFSHLGQSKYSGPKRDSSNGRGARVDLHGLRLQEAIPVLEKAVNDALLLDVEKFEICHGVGMGVLLTAVHDYLKGLSVVKRFHLDEHNPGVTWVYFG